MAINFSRAGLFAIVLLLCLTLATSAPLPPTSSLTVRSETDHVNILVKRSDATLSKRDFDEQDLFSRDALDTDMLVRRKSIFTKIKEGFKKVGSGIKKAAQKVGAGIKKAAQKVGQFVKTTGAKIVKFGLKIASAASSIAAKVVKFIPGVGTALSKGLQAHSMATNALSNKIHVSLGKKLDKGMKVLDKIRNPVGGVAGKVLNAFRREDEDDEMLEREILGSEEQQSVWARVPEEYTEEDVLEREFDMEAEVEEREEDEQDILDRDLDDADFEERDEDEFEARDLGVDEIEE